MFDRSVKRLEDPEVVTALIRSLLEAGYERETIETALIRQAPVDLDLLADCYLRLTMASAALAQAAEEHSENAAHIRQRSAA
ncbi:hypothetical protein [Jiella marina]|uniref:hypothetical protein n=1 Tax=Jiella sp. LLJ827 TaxID=2917712 RepID=UPI002100AD0F|nr:hypothetical protein [Jiella sp. LLJ827]MCQ0987964.1 hypothetical protein [Jiella sp. LLJ827]